MYGRWIYMCFIFYVTLESSYSQCYSNNTCECHCYIQCVYCTSCGKGWGGSTSNKCQRQNIAYRQRTSQISTDTASSNAVDGNSSTYSRTGYEKNPWISVNFDKIQGVKYMSITLTAETGRYFIYVKNSSTENLNTESLCAEIQSNRNQRFDWNITCKNDQVFTGDQIFVLRETTGGSLTVIDIKVFQCSSGTYGYLCDKKCVNCVDNQCDGFTGICRMGCKSGWYGERCVVECPSEGYYLDRDRNCQSCPSNCLSCDSESNCTRCKQTFTGNLCDSKCNVNCIEDLCEIDGRCLFGCNNKKHGIGCTTDCRENCVHCYNGNNCTRCLPGYYGVYCTSRCYQNCYNCTSFYCETCKPGSYGSYCQYPCSSDCLTCDSKDSCTSCREGWSGNSCQCNSKCDDGCGSNGKCLNGCKGSLYGDYCNTSCPWENCEKCDQKSGNCTECTDGRYGIHCDMGCSGTCLGTTCDITGECLRGCVEGFSGANCAEQIPSKTGSPTMPYVYAVAVLGGLLLVLAVTLVVFFVKRKRERERAIRMTYQTVRVACQEADREYECVNREPEYQTIDS